MYRGPCLADISEAEEEANEDSLSSASTASFWSHERELYDPWWRATPPTAAAIRASSSTPPLYRGLVRTAPPTSPVRTRARRPKRSAPTGRSTTPPAHSYAPPRRRARPYGGGGDGRDNSGGSGGSVPPAANGHASQTGQQQQQQQQKDRQPNPATTKKSPAQKGQVSFALLTTEITRDEGPAGASPALGPPPPAPPQPAAEMNYSMGPGLASLPPVPHPSAGPCGADTDAYWLTQGDNLEPSKPQRASMAGPNDLFFGEGDDKSSGASLKDREERLRQLRDRQQLEKQQKLEELKEHAAAAQRFREQQENERRKRLEEMRMRDADRRQQVEERKKIIQQAEQDRREAVIRKNIHDPCFPHQEREQRLESKRRNERSNIVFAFGSSTPRMLDPKDNSNSSYWASRRATSTTNVHMVDGSLARRASECGETDLSRKRATSAHGLDRKPEGTRLTKSRDSSLERKTPPSALTWVRSYTPQPNPQSSTPVSAGDPHPPSSTSSSSSDKTPTNTSQSRFCVWEFGDNFTALGPTNQSSGGNGQPASSSPASTPTSSTRYSHRTASVFTGAGCTVGGEDLMTRSMTAAIPTTAARRRTDLMPAMPSLRDSTANRSSPRHRSPGRALSLGRLDELARPRHRNPPLAPLHESSPSCDRMTPPTRTMSKSMSHLGPRPPRPPGPEVATSALDRGVSRSSVSLAQPRLTRAEMLRQKKLRGAAEDTNSLSTKSSQRAQGMRSGTVTPNSPSRPTSALSQGSTNSSQVSYRPRTSPRKPRPLSIAGSSLSSADKPRDAASESREGRPMERKLSAGSASSFTKPTRAKSAGSERSTPSTPARTPVKVATPKKTPAQVKAESAAKKAVEKSKSTPKAKVTPKTTPLQSPSVESKPLVVAKPKKSSSPREGSTVEDKDQTEAIKVEDKPADDVAKVEEKPSTEATKVEEKPLCEEQMIQEEIKPEAKPATEEPAAPVEVQAVPPTAEPTAPPAQEKEKKEVPSESKDATSAPQDTKTEKDNIIQDSAETKAEAEKSLAQKASEKPVTGYATEEEYKAALAEKRRQAREAKERELELERQRQLEEEEQERREEEEYLRLMEEQRKAEEERLRKAIEEAERNRVEEAKKREEEEKQRLEAERIEQQKRLEAEVRLKKEEEERQARKSRVAAIMARTRGKGGSNTPTKNESKTPSEEGKNFGDGLMSTSMTESMTNSMIAEIQAETAAAATDKQQDDSQPSAPEPSQPQPPAVSQTVTATDSTSTKNQDVSLVEVTQSSVVEDIVSGVASVKIEEPHVNGDSPVPMETTPTHTVDLLGTISDVNSVNLNGVDNSTPPQTSQGRTDNLLDSLDPLSSSLSTSTTTTTTTSTTTPAASNFEQIIDLGQTKLSNEDAVNSNPPSPFIAFEQNLNKKPNQENASTVPDLLL
ncbi:MAP7 domain-containing protein 1-like isoform X3 [Portunus trituberculatus]|uniref:MAP7 domain-containing protein 1-like isoform X3 n=1 Tax=Portunus trituberculatus TaxID=210409 RepID=UPI001E1CD04E|nr:MAP7 domain-containing protein 1-like isoform X3 [Portunus trituberculatus]